MTKHAIYLMPSSKKPLNEVNEMSEMSEMSKLSKQQRK